MSRYPQTITRWETTADGLGGFTFSEPEIIKGRWEDKAVQVRTPAGDEITSRSIVYTQCDINIGDYLYLGETIEADPTTLTSAYEVKQWMKVPSLNALQFDRKAIL